MVVFRRRSIFIISVLLLTVITFIVCFGALKQKPIGETSSSNIKVVLDAGHGGIDAGVSGVNTGVKESELNLAVVKKLEGYLNGAGISVVLTRSTDAGLYGVATSSLKKKDMQKRKEIIEKAQPNMVISVHMNDYSLSTRRGGQVFYKKGSQDGQKLALSIQESLNAMDEAVRECSALSGDYYILNCTDYPSVICECGFLSNPEDEALLITSEYQDAIAYGIFKGVVAYLTQSSIAFTD